MNPAEMAALHARAFPADRGWSAREFEGFLGDPLCFATTSPHAFALVRAVADEAELLTICTDPEHRRTGLGRTVLAEAIREAATRGARRMFLEVEAENTAAIALYESLDFSETGRRRDYYGRGRHAVMMARDLPLG